VTIETTLEGAVADTSSEDPVIEDTPAVSDDTAETEIKHPEGTHDDAGVADATEATPAMTEADMADDPAVIEVSSIAEALLCLRLWNTFIYLC
jgi:hypothetical protein